MSTQRPPTLDRTEFLARVLVSDGPALPDIGMAEGTAIELLEDTHRRLAIHWLGSHDVGERVAVTDVAEAVATREQRDESDDVDPRSIEYVRTSLMKKHVPKLADYAIVKVREDGDNYLTELEVCERAVELAVLVDELRATGGRGR